MRPSTAAPMEAHRTVSLSLLANSVTIDPLPKGFEDPYKGGDADRQLHERTIPFYLYRGGQAVL
jgi:hypothetical protein